MENVRGQEGFGDIMQCTNPVRLFRVKTKCGYKPLVEYPEGLVVPCGKCMACRVSKRREWSLRMIHELSSWEDAVFITLTYDDEHLPWNDKEICWPTLRKSDLQKFFKRLRRSLGERKIKYFACGEYGDKTDRPHYHAIVFGLSLRNEDKVLVMEAWPFCDWKVSTIRKNSFGLAEQNSIAYVAQYIDKKYSGDLANDQYVSKNRDSVFRILSLGIGAKYCSSHGKQLLENGGITMNGNDISFPRYYLNKLEESNEVELLKMRDGILEEIEEADRDVTNEYVGRKMTDAEAYRQLKPSEYKVLSEGKKSACIQHERNLNAKVKLKTSKI